MPTRHYLRRLPAVGVLAPMLHALDAQALPCISLRVISATKAAAPDPR